jgi:hypothetical protein
MRWSRKKEAAPDDKAGGRSGRRVGVAPATMVRATAACLWVLVVLGAVSGVAALARPGPRSASAAPPTAASPVAASGWAELYVSAWLAAGDGDEDQLRPFFPEVPSLTGVRSGGLWAARTAAVAAAETAPGYWSVTVAADVMAADEAGGWTPAGTRYYRVAVASTPSGAALVSTGLPAQVAAPALARSPRLVFQSAGQVPVDLGDSVERFVAAYVAGDGELARYVAPGSPLRPVRPAPYAKVEISSVALDGPVVPGRPVRVLASVRATDPAGRVAFLSYPLALAARDGRWEVTELLAVPPLAAPGPIGTPPTTTPTTPTSPATSTTSAGGRAPLPGAPTPPARGPAAPVPSTTSPVPTATPAP